MAVFPWCGAAAFSVLLVSCVVHEAAGVISGPLFPRSNGVIEPKVMEVQGEDGSWLPRKVERRSSGEYAAFRESLVRLHKRQSEANTTGHIGTAVPLEGDGHTFALVHWTGHPSEFIFILTRRRVGGYSTESWLWRSTDYGKSFHNETNKTDSDAVLEWYYISAQNNILVFTDRIHHRVYVTTDEGETYNGYETGFRPDRLTFQSATNPGNVTADSWPKHVLGYDSSDRTLYVSSNLGIGGSSSWVRLGTNVTRYQWRVLDSTYENDTAVYFEMSVNETHSQLWVASHPYTEPQLFDPDLGPFETNSFVLSHEYMFVQKNTSGGGTYKSPLWVSRNRTMFKQAAFPLQTQEKHYSLVDASEGQVFIAVYHDPNNTNLYLSEEAGLSYALSLEHIVAPPESEWLNANPRFDIHVVDGIVGTYMANRKLPGSSYGATVISFDKGGEWRAVTPPAVDYLGHPVTCYPPECSLHFHMDSDRNYGFQSILSQDSAVGLIMALGNLGSNLQRFDYGALRMYFSYDGGFTWREVNRGFWEFQFTALGSIIATVQKWQPTNFVQWSCDEGATWTNTTFDINETMRLVGIRTERGEKANHITVFGYVPPFTEWLVMDLDFSTVVPNQCVYPDNYYIWEPADERPGGRCLLGETIEYERRQSDTCCYIDPEYERPVNRTPCVCAIEDFECDFGFERVNLNSPCTPMQGTVYPQPPPSDCPENGTYSYTSGYRKVAGDKCVRGNETYFFPIERPCPIYAPQGLYILKDKTVVSPGTSITFTLDQILGGKVFTNYTWNFGDGSEVKGRGYSAFHIQQHSYSEPGEYRVTVTAINVGGEATTFSVVSVQDPIATVTIVLPNKYEDGHFPQGVELVFQSNYTTQYGTNFTGDITYAWIFGEGGIGSSPTVTHTYRNADNYTITLLARNAVNVGTVSDAVVVTVIGAPQGLRILEDRRVASPGTNVNFTLLQALGGKLYTDYTWNFGDGSAEIKGRGYSAFHIQQHSYSQPGEYQVTVTAANIAGEMTAFSVVTIRDLIATVTIVLPSTYSHSHFPQGVELVFQSDYTTQYSTNFTGDIVYSWNFGDGEVGGPLPTETHTYDQAGGYTITLTAYGLVNMVSVSVNVTVYEGVGADDVNIESSDVTVDGYVKIGMPITFTVTSKDPSKEIPEHATYHWAVHPNASTVSVDKQELQVTFTQYGRYQISVKGGYPAGSFSKEIVLTAEYNIVDVSVYVKPTIRARRSTVANLTVNTTGLADSPPYMGPLSMTAWYNGSVLNDKYVPESSGGPEQLDVTINDAGAVEIGFTVSNDVSNHSSTQKVNVADHGQYGSVRFEFNPSKLPSGYNTGKWRNELGDSIHDALVSDVHSPGLKPWQVEVTVQEIANDTTRPAGVKRATETKIVVAHAIILPSSLQKTDTVVVTQFAQELVDRTEAGRLDFTVDNHTVHVDNAIFDPEAAVVIIIPSVETETETKENKTLYLGLGLGLGVGLMLVLAFAALMVFVTWRYHRKYSRLNVRYSRLQQTPVRFTFSEGGGMEEEEEEKDQEGEGDMEDKDITL